MLILLLSLINQVLNELEKEEETDRHRVLEQATAIIQGTLDSESVEHENSTNYEGDVETNETVQNEESQMVKTEAYSEESRQEDNSFGDGNTNLTLEPGLILVSLNAVFVQIFWSSSMLSQ